jgi:putative transcriptional regulator
MKTETSASDDPGRKYSECVRCNMAIVVNLDVVLAKRKMTSLELSRRIGITQANLSILKTGKAKAIRMATMNAICRELQCQPGDLLEFVEDKED